MKFFLLFFIFLILLTKPALFAKTYRDNGFSGDLSFLYEEQTSTIDSTETTVQNFMQALNLKYMGNIYNPKLLNYTIATSVKYNKVDSESGSIHSASKSDSYDYNANLNFIQATRFPFSISANKITSPISTISPDEKIYYTNESESKTFNGSVNLRSFMLSYAASTSSDLSDDGNSLKTRESDLYNATLDYINKSHRTKISYNRSKINNKINYYFLGDDTEIMQDTLQITLQDTWDVSKTFKYASSASYVNENIASNTIANAGVNLTWEPTRIYNTSISANISRSEYKQDINSSIVSVTDSYTVNNNHIYKILPNLVITGNALFSASSSLGLETEITSLYLDSRYKYKKIFFKDVNFNMDLGLEFQKNDYKTVNTLENNTTIVTEELSRFYTNANISKNKDLKSIDSRLIMYGRYFYSTDSAKSTDQEYNIKLTLNTKLFTIFENSIIANYEQRDQSRKSTKESNAASVSSTTMSIDESLYVLFRLGFRGDVSFGVSANYLDTGTTTSFSQSANSRLKYRLSRRTQYMAHLRANKSETSISYTGTTSLVFLAGLTSFSIGYKYSGNELTVGEKKRNDVRSIFNARLTRRF